MPLTTSEWWAVYSTPLLEIPEVELPFHTFCNFKPRPEIHIRFFWLTCNLADHLHRIRCILQSKQPHVMLRHPHRNPKTQRQYNCPILKQANKAIQRENSRDNLNKLMVVHILLCHYDSVQEFVNLPTSPTLAKDVHSK
jgi:hypothetical protein